MSIRPSPPPARNIWSSNSRSTARAARTETTTPPSRRRWKSITCESGGSS